MKLITYPSVLALFFHTCVLASTPAEFHEHFKLLPQPQKVELISGTGLFYTDLRGIHLQDGVSRPVMTGLLANLPRIGFPLSGSVALVIDAKLGLPSGEGYLLEIVDGMAKVQAMDPAGLFY